MANLHAFQSLTATVSKPTLRAWLHAEFEREVAHLNVRRAELVVRCEGSEKSADLAEATAYGFQATTGAVDMATSDQAKTVQLASRVREIRAEVRELGHLLVAIDHATESEWKLTLGALASLRPAGD